MKGKPKNKKYQNNVHKMYIRFRSCQLRDRTRSYLFNSDPDLQRLCEF